MHSHLAHFPHSVTICKRKTRIRVKVAMCEQQVKHCATLQTAAACTVLDLSTLHQLLKRRTNTCHDCMLFEDIAGMFFHNEYRQRGTHAMGATQCEAMNHTCRQVCTRVWEEATVTPQTSLTCASDCDATRTTGTPGRLALTKARHAASNKSRK